MNAMDSCLCLCVCLSVSVFPNKGGTKRLSPASDRGLNRKTFVNHLAIAYKVRSSRSINSLAVCYRYRNERIYSF